MFSRIAHLQTLFGTSQLLDPRRSTPLSRRRPAAANHSSPLQIGTLLQESRATASLHYPAKHDLKKMRVVLLTICVIVVTLGRDDDH